MRIILAAAALLSVLAFLLPRAATRLIGQDLLRAEAQAALSAALDRPVDIQGDVRLTMVPWFGLRTGKVTVANDPGFGPEPLLSVDSVTIGLNLPALVSRRIVVDSVAMSSAVLHLGRDASGRENWRVSPRETPSPREDGWKVESLPSGLRMSNAHLSYTDALTGLSLDVRRLNLNTSQSRPFEFSLSCEATVNPLGLTGELHVQGVGSYGQSGEAVFVHKSQAAGWLQLPPASGLPGERVLFSGKVRVHGEQGAFEVANLVLDGLGVRVTGQVNAGGLYLEQPYVYLNLAAKAARRGEWTKLLGLNLAGHPGGHPPSPKGSAVSEPVISQPAPSGDIEAELELASTPVGWLAKKVLLRDGPGKVSGMVKNIGGNVSFDVSANDWNLGSWLGAAAIPWTGSGSGFKSLRGRLSGRDLRLGSLEVDDMELSALGDKGELRIYPFTAKAGQALITTDIRIKPGPVASSFSATSSIQSMSPGSSAQGEPLTMAELNASGEAGPDGAAGKLRLGVADYSQDWKPAWLPDEALKAWSLLGGGGANASFRFPARGAWELTDLDVQSGSFHVTGKASGGKAATILDLQADRLDLDRLRQLGEVFGGEGDGWAPWPIEARVAAKRLSAPGLDIDDLVVAGQASAGSIKLSTVTGATLGGKFSGGLDFENAPGGKTLSVSLSASGVQSSQLSGLWPQLPKANGPIDCRLAAESSVGAGVPVWQELHGQADLQMGQGSIAFSAEQGRPQPWPLSRATASLKFAARPAPAQTGDKGHEAVLADLSGPVRVDSPGVVRSSLVEIRGQLGLDASGKPLWFRQPKAEGSHLLVLPFGGPGKTVRATWSGKFDADLDKGAFAFSSLDLNLAGIPGKAALSGQPGQGGLTLAGTLDIPEFNPREAAPRLGLAIPSGADPNVWRRARLSADIGGTLKEIRLGRIQGALDDAVITGQASIAPARNRLDLAVTTLDLDRLNPAPQYTDPTKRPEEPLPLAELRDLSLDARLRFGWLIKDRLIWENALTEFTAQGGRFELRQTAPSFYGGPYLFDLKGDARGNELKAQMEIKLSSFQAPLLLRDLAGGTGLTAGQCDFNVNVETHGATDRALRRHAGGTASFEVRGGKLAIKEAAGRGREPSPPPPPMGDRDAPRPAPPPPSDGLAFSKMGATFTVREGLAITRDMILVGDGVTAKGDGWVSLDDERIDLNLMAAVPDVGELPVRISGPLYDPKLDIDKSRILGDTIMNIFKGVIRIPGNVLHQLRRVF